MKKYISYIFILIILTGILIPFFKISAESPDDMGTCAKKNITSGIVTTTQTLRKDCDTAHPPDGFSLSFSYTPGNTLTDGGPAPTPASNTINKNYKLLAPLPCPEGTPGCDSDQLTTFDPTNTDNFVSYLNLIIKIFIGISAVLAVIMIVRGGIEYITSELISSKEAGKDHIKSAIFGLILALGAWLLLNTINPDILSGNLDSLKEQNVEVTLEDQIKSYSGQGTCAPITSGQCSPASLAAAGFLPEPPRATQASSICNGESRGNSGLGSGVDKCSDGNSFSFGLFQVNIIAHANEIPGGVCSNIFKINGGGTQGSCLQKQGNICIKYDCSVVDSAKYQSCISYITNPTNNITYAKNLQATRGWSQWGANASCHF